ncbi:MAG: polyprenyl synthetase family protein [Gemmatimonadota bacterium]
MLEAVLPSLQSIREPIAARLEEVQGDLAAMVRADYDRVDEVADYVAESAGKLLRPTLLLLANEIGGNSSRHAVRLAAIVELMHVATLVHDDSVDHSPTRRGRPTVNGRWSHQVAVIMGDYLYSRALVEIGRFGDVEAIQLLASASNRMSIGEMRQLSAHDALSTTEDDYYRLCEDKTASLISASCELGAMFGAPAHRGALRRFGHHIGMTFQIIDDTLDYTAGEELTGKPSGLDLREHKVTLPLILALPRLSTEGRQAVRTLFANPRPSNEQLTGVIDLVAAAGGIEGARSRAQTFAERARGELAALPPAEPAVQALELAIGFILQRQR